MYTICGITQSTLANINTRPNTNLNILTIMRICRGLDISFDVFLILLYLILII